jgi:hypothetical protein
MYSKFFDSLGKEGYICTVRNSYNENGKLTYTVETKNDNSHFCELTAEEQKKALTWLQYNLIPAKTPLSGHTSYGMKHILEDRTKIYLTNNQMKELMLLCGFFPVEPDELNWSFYVRKSSPMFKRQTDDKPGLPMMGDPMDYSHQEPVIDFV